MPVNLELWQAEWCPHCHRVRQRLTELGVDCAVHQVPAQRDARTELRRASGQDTVPVLRAGDGTLLIGAQEAIAYLDDHYPEPRDAQIHRERAHLICR